MNKERIYIGFFVLSLLAFVVFEWAKPRPIDWTESYSGLDKIPFGCYIIRDMLPELFPGQALSYGNEPIFTTPWDSAITKNTIFINGSFAPDEYETEKLIKQAEAGHTFFISANMLYGTLADTLGIEINHPPPLNITDETGLSSDSLAVNFQNLQIREEKPWQYAIGVSNYYFSDFDSLNTTALGTTGEGEANYIAVQRGKGTFYLHTQPQVFTNYHMLDKRKVEYAFKALSYLPVQPTTWDEYYKFGRTTAGSPMRYIVSHEYLRWAWITALSGLFLFIIFRARRTQRIIPEIQKPQNTSLQFTRTIGRLYHEQGNRKDIAQKKVTYFLEYIRSRLRLDTRQFDKEFLTNVSQRSGMDRNTIQELFEQITSANNKTTLSSDELHTLNKKIEHFYQHTSR